MSLGKNFKIDGKQYPAMWGATATWKQLDPNSWETTIKLGGRTTTVFREERPPEFVRR